MVIGVLLEKPLLLWPHMVFQVKIKCINRTGSLRLVDNLRVWGKMDHK